MKNNPTLTNSKPYFKATRPHQNQALGNLGAPHIDSFNYMLREGLADCVKNIRAVQFELPSKDRISLRVSELTILPAKVPHTAIGVRHNRIYPTECRQRAATYKGMAVAKIEYTVNGQQMSAIERELGEVPIMLRSSVCNLSDMTNKQLVDHGEHENEWGGYFIVNGHEKLIRMLLMTRKNYPIAVKRSTWKNRGIKFSDIGILLRSVRTDHTATNNVLHFITNGTSKFMFSYRKMLSFVPPLLLLRALTNNSDEFIYQQLIRGYEDDQYYISCVQQMLREIHEQGIHTQEQCKEYLGEIFRTRFYDLHSWITNAELTDVMLNECIMIHVDDPMDKFNLLVFMVQKLFQCVQNKCKIEGADGVMMQELLLGGHLYQKVIKDRVESWLQYLKMGILKRATDESCTLDRAKMMIAMKSSSGLERSLENFLSTGNLVSSSGLGLMQNSGLVIMAENINRMRYMSHFRAVHRGSYFVEMRTTEARQLLPDAWGFICPVHTPDGTPCGLLNHLTVNCIVSDSPDQKLVDNIPKVLIDLGMIPLSSHIAFAYKDYFVVMLEGKVLGHIQHSTIARVENGLRTMKIAGQILPKMMEIVVVPNKKSGQYPGLFLFVGSARMMRPVTNLANNAIEYIGTFEQVYMEICICPEEAYPGQTTHMELSKTSFMSNLANLIPMPDCNQSPRNMYQCQMGKQTMGTPCHNWPLQSETKLYRLQTPATPLFRPVHHDNIELDDYAMGTNAVVAVISYTGYDMEDAMIINKSAYERGFAHGSIQKSEFIELKGDSFFARNPLDKTLAEYLDNDGFPFAGRAMHYNDPFYCYYDSDLASYTVVNFKAKEACFVDNIKLCGDFIVSGAKKACITVRIPRNPSVGDKFASRSGQKGICSQKWPAEDLPFTESGLVPDIVFNPHGFPSRMTIAMMIETMAGKTASVHGLVHDATPFRFNEKNTAIDYFGTLLKDGGYNYYGTEKLYSGIDGREMQADIFFGVVHYQRLRHMVSDKWQVRSTGTMDARTHQPIKGRKVGGGIRFGEMERDALIAHGASFLLHDRLFHCSDKISAHICKKCGTLLGPTTPAKRFTGDNRNNQPYVSCRLCLADSDIGTIDIPYIFKFLVIQLFSVNINVKLTASNLSAL